MGTSLRAFAQRVYGLVRCANPRAAPAPMIPETEARDGGRVANLPFVPEEGWQPAPTKFMFNRMCGEPPVEAFATGGAAHFSQQRSWTGPFTARNLDVTPTKPSATYDKRALAKSPTGIKGLDEIIGGGLPKGRPTLVCGSAGCGKTLLAIEFLVRGAMEFDETGEYDLEGLFIRLGHAIDSLGAKRVVLDTIETLFSGLANTAILRAELRRLFR